MNSLSKIVSDEHVPSSEFMIKRVSLRRWEAFRYSPVPGDNTMLEPDSILSPGDYAIFYQGNGVLKLTL